MPSEQDSPQDGPLIAPRAKDATRPERPLNEQDSPDEATRSAVRLLLARPGALEEGDRIDVHNTLSSGTTGTRINAHRVLAHRARQILRIGLNQEMGLRFQRDFHEPTPGREEVLERIIETAFPVGSDMGTFLLRVEEYACTLSRPQPDVQRELDANHVTRHNTNGAPPADSLGEALGTTADSFIEVMRDIIDGKEADAIRKLRDIGTGAPDTITTERIERPRGAYERLARENAVTYAQARRTREWEAALGVLTVGTASKVVAELAARHAAIRSAGTDDTRALAVPRYLTTGGTLGLPEYDLPVRSVMTLHAPLRDALLQAFRVGALNGKGEERVFCEDMVRSMELLEERLKTGVPSLDLDDQFAVVRQRLAAMDRAAGRASKKREKWKDCLQDVFGGDHAGAQALLDTLGYLPDALFRDPDDPDAVSRTLSKDISFSKLASLHEELVQKLRHSHSNELPTGRVHFGEQRLLNARAQLLEVIVLSEKSRTLAGKVMVDTNGVYYVLQQRTGREVQAELSAHVPFRYVSDTVIDRLLADQRITGDDASEIRMQRAQDLGDYEQAVALDRRKAAVIAERLGVPTGDPLDTVTMQVEDPARHEAFVKLVHPNAKSILRLPRSAADRSLARAKEQGPDAFRTSVEALLRLGASMQKRIGAATKSADPRYYDIQKAVLEPLADAIKATDRIPGLVYRYIDSEPGQRQRMRIQLVGAEGTAILVDLDRLGDIYQNRLTERMTTERILPPQTQADA